MKILYLVASEGIYYDMRGGAGTHIRGTIKAFRDHGHEVTPLLFGDYLRKNLNSQGEDDVVVEKSKSTKDFLPQKLRVLGREFNSIRRKKKYRALIEDYLVDNRPDFIYERSCLFSVDGGRLARKHGIPYFLETSGCIAELADDAYGVPSVQLANYIERLKLQSADVVVTEAKSAIPFVRDKFNLKNAKIIAKPLGVYLPVDEDSNIREGRISILRKSLGLSEEDIVVGYVGSFASYHRVESFIPYFRENEALRFLMVGAGGNYEYCKEKVCELGLSNVIFTGYVKEGLSDYLGIMDLGLIPDCEPHMAPIKYFEYGIYGVCPIVPDYWAFERLCENKVNGFKFRPNDHSSISSMFSTIMNCKREEVKEKGESWSQEVRSNFEWKEVVREVILTAQNNN
ncbi:hypothetical protein FUAX_24890 [Fulvitalea axinellae]|uniref:Glycosyltransferase n=1 Tax=Fulvitalea axinellae TaxID=1182444 RepID=A0AAU9CX97_9BACT|nr:hypothetical protein FUAX_24890 [Fulvitalea axinellae]